MEVHLPHSPNRSGRFAKLEAWLAVFIALTSLSITLYEARATREHDRMSVWPRIAQEASDSAGIYDRSVSNVGLGPAVVRSFDVRLDDTVRTSWTPVVAALLARPNNATWFFSTVGPGTVILPGHSIHVLSIVAHDLSSAAMAQDHRLVSSVCYCSLYDECWTAQSNHAEPTSTPSCAAPADKSTISR